MKPAQTSVLVPYSWIVVRPASLCHSPPHSPMMLTFLLLSPLTSMKPDELRLLGHFAASSVPRKQEKKYFLYTLLAFIWHYNKDCI
jgi:hypothetical protein